MSNLAQDSLEIIEFLKSLYFDQEFTFVSDQDEKVYKQLQQEQNVLDKQYIEMIIKAPIKELFLCFYCRLSLISENYDLSLPSSDNHWLSRQDHKQLTDALAAVEGDDRASRIIESIQTISTLAEPMLEEYEKQQQKQLKKDTSDEPIEFLREWIWFPMIYTREKRGHIIDWAPSYNITGFLCPGKPGCMCLEGPKEKVNQFIHDIKTVSWSDIPSSHKKMTSQWKEQAQCLTREEVDKCRLFKDMTEVKFDIHGAFSNHNNLGMLQAWMEEKGCGKAFNYLFECRET
ncbi:hypothetical protein CU097_007311 [Rhizopus azygosporus]|uniref:Small nuclear ribonucleoprotein Prp3 C-terminal domain-containing protein n=1 Tax=Rhizopus azygosporus TaxID=86630 RepID=A0A367J596_RHIAZ|nr:hypothetical protein CU097_007311 [Rhizopus azygosporus]